MEIWSNLVKSCTKNIAYRCPKFCNSDNYRRQWKHLSTFLRKHFSSNLPTSLQPTTHLTFGTHRNWVAGFALSGTKQQGYGFNGHYNGCDDINKEILRIYFISETSRNFSWPKMKISIFVLSFFTLVLYTQVEGQSGQSQQDELSILEIVDATAQLSEVFIWNYVSKKIRRF